MRLPASRPAAVRGPSPTGLINTPSLTRPAGDPSVRAQGGRNPGVHRGLRGHTPRGRPCARSSLPADSHRSEARRRGDSGARPELRPQAPAEGARRRLPRHAHGALLRAGANRGHPARTRLQRTPGDRAQAQARGGAGARVEASGTVHRNDEKSDRAYPLVGEADRPPGGGARQRRTRHRQPRVRDERGPQRRPRSREARAGEGPARGDGAASGGGVRASQGGGDQVHARARSTRRSAWWEAVP